MLVAHYNSSKNKQKIMNKFVKRRFRLLFLLILIIACFYFTIQNLNRTKQQVPNETISSQPTHSPSGMTLPLKIGINAAAKMARNLLKNDDSSGDKVVLSQTGRIDDQQLLFKMEEKLNAQNQLIYSLQDQIKATLSKHFEIHNLDEISDKHSKMIENHQEAFKALGVDKKKDKVDDNEQYKTPFFRRIVFPQPPVSTINCFGNSTSNRICKARFLCWNPKEDRFFIFKDLNGMENEVPRNRTYLVDMTSIDGHNKFFFDYQDIDPRSMMNKNGTGLVLRVVDKLTFVLSRFHALNIMHTLHDDFFGLYLLHRMFAPANPQDEVTGLFQFGFDNNLFFTDMYEDLRYDYIFKLLSLREFQFRHRWIRQNKDAEDPVEPLCFRDAIIGNSKLVSWYSYGFKEPQGPIPNKTVSGLLIRNIATFIMSRIGIPKWEEGGISSIMEEISDLIKNRGKKKRSKLLYKMSDKYYITIFSRKLDRIIINESELAKTLEAYYGMAVKYVRMEDMGLAEQISILRMTAIAIGMHGSALILSIFLPPGALLVEMFPFAVPSENYTPYKTMCNIEGMQLTYRSWTNSHPENNQPHPEKPPSGGGIRHLSVEQQQQIENSLTVVPHICCSDPTWLYRIYQDTRIELNEIMDVIDDGILSSLKKLVDEDPKKMVRLRPGLIESVKCRVSSNPANNTQMDLHISWSDPWNGVKASQYGIWIHQPFKEFLSTINEMVLENCTPKQKYDIWVRPYKKEYSMKTGQEEIFRGTYSDKYTCNCELDSVTNRTRNYEL